MKRLAIALLALLLACSLMACSDDAAKDTKDTTGTTAADTTAATEPAASGTNASDTNATTGTTAAPSDDPAPAEVIKADVLHEDIYYEFIWEETDGANGVLTVSEYMVATADEMAELGLSGDLTYKAYIVTYNVTYEKSADGVYVAEGSVVSAASAVEGASADAFIQMMKSSLEEPDGVDGRVLDGEVLTAKEDIESFLMRNDSTVKVTFSVQNGNMAVSQYECNYIVWGPLVPVKDVCHIQNDVVRSWEEHYDGELESITTYREDGTVERCDSYWEGEVSNTVRYDENGDEIEE